MGNANLFHIFGGRKIVQTQQHTSFAVLEIVSGCETVFHLRKKGKSSNSLHQWTDDLCQLADDKKGRIFRPTHSHKLKCCFKYSSGPASCVLAETRLGPRP